MFNKLLNVFKKNTEETTGRVFKLGQTVYFVNKERIGRYVIVEFVTKESKDKVEHQIVVEDPTGRQTIFTPEEAEEHLFFDIEVAKELAIENWQIITKQVKEGLETFSDKVIDDAVEKFKQQQEAKKKAGK